MIINNEGLSLSHHGREPWAAPVDGTYIRLIDRSNGHGNIWSERRSMWPCTAIDGATLNAV